MTIPVSVNDGTDESAKFNLKVEVKKNVEPKITDQVALSINQGQSLTIAFSHLVVSDPDNTYPTGFTLTVYTGNNYTFAGTTITPAADFSGNLKVPVSVNDGLNESKKFDLKVEVKKIQNQNVEPTITGQVALSISQGQPITIALSHLVVTDPDNAYPTGFTLTVYAGNNYNFAGTTVTPDANFSGNLKVSVSVNDGQNESKKFDLKIEVMKVQPAAPQITAQKALTTNEDQASSNHLCRPDSGRSRQYIPAGLYLEAFSRSTLFSFGVYHYSR